MLPLAAARLAIFPVIVLAAREFRVKMLPVATARLATLPVIALAARELRL